MIAAVSLKPAAFADDCRLAQVVISRFATPARCDDVATVIDGDDLKRGGAHALYLHSDQGGEPAFRIETAYPATRRAFMPPTPQ